MSGTISTLTNIMAQYVGGIANGITAGTGRNGLESAAALVLVRRALTSGNYTAVFTDRACALKINSATAATVTVPSGVFSPHQGFSVLQEGAGQVTLLASGTTFLPTGIGPSTRIQGSLITVVFDPDVANQVWVFGDYV